MKASFLLTVLLCSLVLFSCKKDDGISCTNCSSPNTTDFQVCEERDGNASVGGQNTGTSFADYIAALEAGGASCGN